MALRRAGTESTVSKSHDKKKGLSHSRQWAHGNDRLYFSPRPNPFSLQNTGCNAGWLGQRQWIILWAESLRLLTCRSGRVLSWFFPCRVLPVMSYTRATRAQRARRRASGLFGPLWAGPRAGHYRLSPLSPCCRLIDNAPRRCPRVVEITYSQLSRDKCCFGEAPPRPWP